MKTVIVGSQNPVKLASAQEAFAQVFPDETFEFITHSAPSGVSEQPMSSEETYTGACNRLDACQEAYPDAAYYVGLEGGVQEHEGDLYTSGWMVVRSGDSKQYATQAALVLLPPAIAQLVREGKEVGDATDIVFNDTNSKQKNGLVGPLSGGLITRKDFYVHPLIFALSPFAQSELY